MLAVLLSLITAPHDTGVVLEFNQSEGYAVGTLLSVELHEGDIFYKLRIDGEGTFLFDYRFVTCGGNPFCDRIRTEIGI